MGAQGTYTLPFSFHQQERKHSPVTRIEITGQATKPSLQISSQHRAADSPQFCFLPEGTFPPTDYYLKGNSQLPRAPTWNFPQWLQTPEGAPAHGCR